MNLLHNVGLHEYLAFWSKFHMPVPVVPQIVVLQVFVNCARLTLFELILKTFPHYKYHTLLINFLNALIYFSGHLLLLTLI